MKTKLSLYLLLTAALCLSATSVQAGVINPSFEEPVGNLPGVPTGWPTPANGIWTDLGTTEDPAPDADQYVSVNRDYWVCQVTDIITEAGMTYTVSVYARGFDKDSNEATLARLNLFAKDPDTLMAYDEASSLDWTLLTASFTCDEANAGKSLEIALNGMNGRTADRAWQQ
jgi:hypothetical protein